MPELLFKGKEYVFNHHLSVPFRPLVHHPDKARFFEGQRVVDSGQLDPRLMTKQILDNPKMKVSPEEEMALFYDRQRIKNEHNNYMSQIEKAMDDNDDEALTELRQKLAVVEDALADNDQAIAYVGNLSL